MFDGLNLDLWLAIFCAVWIPCFSYWNLRCSRWDIVVDQAALPPRNSEAAQGPTLLPAAKQWIHGEISHLYTQEYSWDISGMLMGNNINGIYIYICIYIWNINMVTIYIYIWNVNEISIRYQWKISLYPPLIKCSRREHPRTKWTFPASKFIELNGRSSGKLCLITGGYMFIMFHPYVVVSTTKMVIVWYVYHGKTIGIYMDILFFPLLPRHKEGNMLFTLH